MSRVTPTGARRRPRPGGRWLVAVVLVALACGWVVAATRGGGVAPAGGGQRGTLPRSPVSAPVPAPVSPPRVSPPRGRAALQAERVAGREVDRILRSTPFVTAGGRRRRLVALTFDDGPSPYTEAIVEILVRMRVPATFFVVGQQLRYFGAGLRDELRHGFLIGDHTINHALLVRLARAGQLAQIAGDARMLRAAGVSPVRLFRPPYGAYDGATLSVLRRLRMLMVLWSVDPGDWRRPGATAIRNGVLRAVRPGAIVILHDGGGDRAQTIAALPGIIRGLRRRGYRLESVPELLALDPPPRHQRLPATIGA